MPFYKVISSNVVYRDLTLRFLHPVSFAGCVTSWLPSPCDRLSRLRVLWNHLTPVSPSLSLSDIGVRYPAIGERHGPPKFFDASLHACHGLKTPAGSRHPVTAMPSRRLPRPTLRRRLHIQVTGLNPFRDGAPSLTTCVVPCVRLRHVVRHF